jgi:endonuclease/exonuclease/phosphatase family metal-dependent hydrolase
MMPPRSSPSTAVAFPVRVLRCGFVLATAILVAAPVPARSSAADAASFSLLSYNVHGLFRLAAKHSPAARSRTIGWLASRYDVVLLQEDFESRRAIKKEMRAHRAFRGNGMRSDPRLMAVKVLLLPAQLLVPRFSPPYGAGLTTFAEPGLVAEPEVIREPYRACAGWTRRTGGDCWATKGFLRVRMRTPGGAEIDLYNTHLDAGPNKASLKARRRQLEQLAAGIEELSPGRAVIVAGDLNCDFSRPGDGDALMAFRQRIGLQDSGAGGELPFWRERDYVLYRSGPTTAVSVEASGEAVEFVNGDRALSDHPALFVRFLAIPLS